MRTGATTRHQSGSDVAPPALHNSGPVPTAVYRTASVGQEYRLDLGGTLLHWSAPPTRLRAPMSCHAPGPGGPGPEHFATPDTVTGIAHFLLDALGGTASEGPGTRGRRDPRERACLALASLAARVREMGWLAPVHGLARWGVVSAPQRVLGAEPSSLAAEWPWLPPGEEYRALRYAWLACAVSYLSPPLVLWTRTPSLTWWRGDGVVTLRWLGPIATAGRSS